MSCCTEAYDIIIFQLTPPTSNQCEEDTDNRSTDVSQTTKTVQICLKIVNLFRQHRFGLVRNETQNQLFSQTAPLTLCKKIYKPIENVELCFGERHPVSKQLYLLRLQKGKELLVSWH